MHKPHPQSDNTGPTFQQSADFLLLLLRAWSTSLEVYFHRGMGERYPGPIGLLVIPLVFFYALCWENRGYDLAPMFWFLIGYFLMLLRHRVSVGWRRRRGIPGGHSYYNGLPVCARRFPHCSEERLKRVVEPLLLILLGASICVINPPLGVYVTLGGLCMGLSCDIYDKLDRARALDLQDSMIDQQMLAERFRQLRGRGFD